MLEEIVIATGHSIRRWRSAAPFVVVALGYLPWATAQDEKPTPCETRGDERWAGFTVATWIGGCKEGLRHGEGIFLVEIPKPKTRIASRLLFSEGRFSKALARYTTRPDGDVFDVVNKVVIKRSDIPAWATFLSSDGADYLLPAKAALGLPLQAPIYALPQASVVSEQLASSAASGRNHTSLGCSATINLSGAQGSVLFDVAAFINSNGGLLNAKHAVAARLRESAPNPGLSRSLSELQAHLSTC